MAEVNVHNIGDQVRVTGTLTTAAGAPVDPSTLVTKVKAPDATITTYTYGTPAFPIENRLAAGVYYVDVTPTQVGEYWYQFLSTGTGQAMDEGMFRVKASAI